jgi:Bax protein
MQTSRIPAFILIIPVLICIACLNQSMTNRNAPQSGISSVQNALAESPISQSSSALGMMSRADVHVFHPRPVVIGNASGYTPPNFTQFRDTQAKKQAFYEYLLPKIHLANQEVILERKWLSALLKNIDHGIYPSDDELGALNRIENRYAVKRNRYLRKPPRSQQRADTPQFERASSIKRRLNAMLIRADIVPASLVLAQAAKESGWGTSRFAREGNNFFGIWCFNRGCGMTPSRRDNNRTHEVATFDSVEEGVRYYIRTINSHFAYADLRSMRANARQQHIRVYGDKLATGLVSYSERGMVYVNEIRSMIQYNQLKRFTRNYSA